jgi:hypothetical protein
MASHRCHKCGATVVEAVEVDSKSTTLAVQAKVRREVRGEQR